MQNVLLVVHLIIAIVLIGAILVQRSEGGALGIGGSGAGGGNLFSARGVGNGITRLTAILAVCFFITSAALTMISTRGGGSGTSVIGSGAVTGGADAPAAPATTGGDAVLPKLGQDAPVAPAAPTAPAAPAAPVNN